MHGEDPRGNHLISLDTFRGRTIAAARGLWHAMTALCGARLAARWEVHALAVEKTGEKTENALPMGTNETRPHSQIQGVRQQHI